MREEKMKKQIIFLFVLATMALIGFTSCEPFIENKITIRNEALESVTVNIRGQLHEVNGNGGVLILNDFKKGTFEYETLYTLPDGISDFSAEGDVAGEIVLNAGTEVLLSYTYTLTDSAYVVYGSMTSTDDINRVDPFEEEGN